MVVMADDIDNRVIQLPDDDFRRVRSFGPWPPATDLISEETWHSLMDLPSDVVVRTTGDEGSLTEEIHRLASDWIWATPLYPAPAPFMGEPSLIAFEEFEGAAFNAIHGYYRQAIGCLRNVLETLAVAASLAVTNDTARYSAWRSGTEIPMREARPLLRDSQEGRRIDAAVTPSSIFGNDSSHWIKRRYARLCAYTHGAAGYTNMDLWGSNGPIFVPAALRRVEDELRETLALAYLLLKLGWSGYTPTDGVRNLLSGSTTGWSEYHGFLVNELL
jgi:hypothetical protein